MGVQKRVQNKALRATLLRGCNLIVITCQRSPKSPVLEALFLEETSVQLLSQGVPHEGSSHGDFNQQSFSIYR